MTQEKFLQAATRYHELKASLDAGEITVSELKQALKKLMIVDDDGRYWMIGGKTGRWYRHDGDQWLQDEPPQAETAALEASPSAEPDLPVVTFPASKADDARKEDPGSQADDPLGRTGPRKAEAFAQEPISQASETREQVQAPLLDEALESEGDARIEVHTQRLSASLPPTDTANCRVCDAGIPVDAEYCPACGANQNETAPPRTTHSHREPPAGTTTLQLRAIHPFSLLFLLGGLGLILGVILGASFGIFDIFGDLIYQFPRMLQETRGKIQGGLIFGVLGGITGFISFALFALVISGLYNLLADLFGGLRMRVRF